MSNDPAHDESHLEAIVAEFIEGDELLDVIGSLDADAYARYEVALLRILRECPDLFGDVYDLLEAQLYVRAEKEHARRMAEGEAARLDLRSAA
jgi:hypothetical protein